MTQGDYPDSEQWPSTPAIEDSDRGSPKERAIWRAVVTQALMDAASNSGKKEAIQERRRARHWLLYDRKDFLTVCMLAELNPHYVREQARQALLRGCRWRGATTSPLRPAPHVVGGRRAKRAVGLPGRVGFISRYMQVMECS